MFDSEKIKNLYYELAYETVYARLEKESELEKELIKAGLTDDDADKLVKEIGLFVVTHHQDKSIKNFSAIAREYPDVFSFLLD
ncbi:hypothetical protein EDC56_3400 [Sinobacterium caligoides]|uniref:Uncharacterized protein n=1 Tax=Sinobacterium caligoides TaxID=933926 RepID=A0A3N2DFU9_9GAMM|nr:hypothetical protein [Sinobacterium caligoides]ROR98667.1 hypothetical protein EDC56_3400 [Sinobacterium caligoides]